MRRTVGLALVASCSLLGAVPAQSRITRIVIERVESPTFEGRSFGAVGRYEKIVGRAFGEVDPADPLNAGITNIGNTQRNAAGRVEYAMDVAIIKPVDMQHGNATLLYDVVNRGSRRAFDVFHFGSPGGNDPGSAGDAGDGFLLERGFTLVVSGWQGDLPRGKRPLITADFPVARRPDGLPITRVITTEYIVTTPRPSLPLGYDNELTARPFPAVEASMGEARLYRRRNAQAPRELIPRSEWSFANCPEGKAATPSDVHLCLPAGFSADWVYELVYEARDPLVMALGFAATRDIVSFLRFETGAANPLIAHSGRTPQPHGIRDAIGFGRSQSGRFIRDLVYLGFNQDEAKRTVFDGVIALTPGSRKTQLNEEFSFPGRFSLPLEGHFAPGDAFPFTYEVITDPVSKRTDGILARCRAQNACPRIMHWDSGTEAWGARNSLVITDPTGTRDVKVPDNVRLYYFAGTQHVPTLKPEDKRFCENLNNPNLYKEAARALLLAMRAWIVEGKSPPASRFPSLAGRDLVRPERASVGFPEIPGLRYTGQINPLGIKDYSVQPPRVIAGTQYAVLVPRTDADGNELAGVRSATLRVPLGTYMGWNTRKPGVNEGEPCYLRGSYVPFARTRAERGVDPRPSLEERYGTRDAYVCRVEAAARELIKEGFLLPGDAEQSISEARKRDLGLHP